MKKSTILWTIVMIIILTPLNYKYWSEFEKYTPDNRPFFESLMGIFLFFVDAMVIILFIGFVCELIIALNKRINKK